MLSSTTLIIIKRDVTVPVSKSAY